MKKILSFLLAVAMIFSVGIVALNSGADLFFLKAGANPLLSAQPSNLAEKALVGEWLFREGWGALQAADTSGNGNTAFLTGDGTHFSGIKEDLGGGNIDYSGFQGASTEANVRRDINGSRDDHVIFLGGMNNNLHDRLEIEHSTSLNMTEGISGSLWVRYGINNAGRYVLSKGGVGANNPGYTLMINNYYPELHLQSADGETIIVKSETQLPTSGWPNRYLAFSWQSEASGGDGKVRLYVGEIGASAVLVSSEEGDSCYFEGPIGVNTDKLLVGIDKGLNTGSAFQGQIDNIRLFNYGITPEAVEILRYSINPAKDYSSVILPTVSNVRAIPGDKRFRVFWDDPARTSEVKKIQIEIINEETGETKSFEENLGVGFKDITGLTNEKGYKIIVRSIMNDDKVSSGVYAVSADPAPMIVSPQKTVDQALVGEWLFNDTAGGTLVTDTSNYGNNGQLKGNSNSFANDGSGGTSTDSRLQINSNDGSRNLTVNSTNYNDRNVIYFHGSRSDYRDYVEINDSDSLNMTNGISGSLWIRNAPAGNDYNSKVNGEYRYIISKGGITDPGYSLVLNDFYPELHLQSPSGETKVVKANVPLANSGWNLRYLAFTWQSEASGGDGKVRIYMNDSAAPATSAVLVSSENSEDCYFNGPIGVSSYNLRIAGDNNRGSRYTVYCGQLDNIRLFNYAISTEDIEVLRYNNNPSNNISTVRLPSVSSAKAYNDNGKILLQWQKPASLSNVKNILIEVKNPKGELITTKTVASNTQSCDIEHLVKGQYYNILIRCIMNDNSPAPGTYAVYAGSAENAEPGLTPPVLAPRAMVGEWKLSEGSGSVINDTSGFNNHGTIYKRTANNVNAVQNAAEWKAGHIDGKKNLYFDGSTYVEIPHSDSLALEHGITISAWVCVEDGGITNHYNVLNKGGGGTIDNSRLGYSLLIFNKNKPMVDFQQEGGIKQTDEVTSNPIGFDKWQHVVCTWQSVATGGAENINFYVDGVKVSSQRRGSTPAVSAIGITDTRALRLGCDDSNNLSTSFFKGMMSNVQLYNYAVSASDVTTIYEKGTLANIITDTDVSKSTDLTVSGNVDASWTVVIPAGSKTINLTDNTNEQPVGEFGVTEAILEYGKKLVITAESMDWSLHGENSGNWNTAFKYSLNSGPVWTFDKAETPLTELAIKLENAADDGTTPDVYSDIITFNIAYVFK